MPLLIPDPVAYPGFTFPAGNKLAEEAKLEKLAWAPDVDERDRIDFIYYIPSAGWEVKEAVVVGPKSTIVRNKRVEEDSQDIFSTPTGIWPTDHKGVLIKFGF